MTEMQTAQHYACLVGDVRTMRRAAHAAGAIIDTLRDDAAENSYRRSGLLEALSLIAYDLEERASFVQCDVLGEDVE